MLDSPLTRRLIGAAGAFFLTGLSYVTFVYDLAHYTP
jgi:hypothetical protein